MRQDPCECLFACRIGYHCGLSLVAYRPEGIRPADTFHCRTATRRCSFLALCATLLTFIFYRKSEAVIAFGYMLCGLALLVAMLGEANPPITQLMPVLASPLLSLHVVTIMIAYSLTAFIMLNGIMAIVLRYTHKDYQDAVVRLQVMSRLILYPAVFCLALGIFIGAVWANVSWGRYWGWDPKETWALITLFIYAAALHASSLPAFRRAYVLSLVCRYRVFERTDYLFWRQFHLRRHT